MVKRDVIKETEKEAEQLNKERQDEIVPIATEVRNIISGANLPSGDYNAHDNDKFKAVAKQVIELLADKNIKYTDIKFLFQCVLQPMDEIKELVDRSLKRSFDEAEERLWGKEFLDLRLMDLDRVLSTKTVDKGIAKA